jgi:hypothetical protein
MNMLWMITVLQATLFVVAASLRPHLKTRGDRRVTGEEWVNSW